MVNLRFGQQNAGTSENIREPQFLLINQKIPVKWVQA